MRFEYAVICLITLLISVGCAQKIQTVQCPDGNSVMVTDTESLFPVYVPVYEVGLKAYLENLDELEKGAEPDFRGKIITLREKADQETSKYRALLQGAFAVMQSKPCDPEAKIKFFELVAKINKRGEDLYLIGQQEGRGRF